MSSTFFVEKRGDPYAALTHFLFSLTISYALFRIVPKPGDPQFLGSELLPGVIILAGAFGVFLAAAQPFERLYYRLGGMVLRRHMTEATISEAKPGEEPRYELEIPPIQKLNLRQQTPFGSTFILCYHKTRSRWHSHYSANLARWSSGKPGLVESGPWVWIRYAIKAPYISRQRTKVIGLWYFCLALSVLIVTNPLLLQFWILLSLVVIGVTAALASAWWFKDSWHLWTLSLHASIFEVKWHELAEKLEARRMRDGTEALGVEYAFPSDLFHHLQAALREDDRVYAESIIRELDRRYSLIRGLR